MLLDFTSYLSRVELALDSLVTVAEINQEDVIATQNFKATLSYHGDLPRGVDS